MPPKSKSHNDIYSEKDIKYLEPREHIRLRPGMYIGGTDKRALHHMVYEIMDEAVDDGLRGDCNCIEVTVHPNRTISVKSNSTGFTTEGRSSQDSTPNLMRIITHAYSKQYKGNIPYVVSGGLHGIGISAINALSSYCVAEVWQNEYYWRQEFSQGLPTIPVQRKSNPSRENGTKITFIPDNTIMEDNDFDFTQIAHRCQELSFLLPNVTFTARYERQDFCIEENYLADKLSGWLQSINRYETKYHEAIQFQATHQATYRQGGTYPIEVAFAFQYIDADTTQITSYVNTIETPDNGTHVDGFYKGIMEVMNACLEEQLSLENVQRGLIAILHVKHPDPQFESQTNIKLLNPEVEQAVWDTVKSALLEHPEVLESIAQKLLAQSRKASYVRFTPDSNYFFKD
jgi:DNA gyrase subunit B